MTSVVLRIVPVVLFSALLAGCASHPRGWSNLASINRIAHENVPVGSPKESAEAFFRNAGVKWLEFPAIPRIGRPNTLVARVDTKFFWPVTTSVGVIFHIGEDQKVKSIQVIEEHTGP